MLSFEMNRYVKITLLCGIAILLLAIGIFLCVGWGNEAIVPENKEATIFIATDTHLFSNNLVGENNKVYLKEKFTSDGRVQEYDYELLGALIDKVNEQNPEFLILTGDLTFNGEMGSHLEVARLLSGVENAKVLVIPGNHDTYSLEAVSVLDDSIQSTKSVTAEEFREIYSDFGYTGAYSYDDTSLSYIYELSDDKWALMLDTTLSKYNVEYDYSITGGGLEDPTLEWLEENLAYAKENGISVISFTHHNLLVHNELFEANYTLRNNSQVIEMFAKYGVQLNFSGHLHIQSIEEISVNENKIYDISGGSLLDYGNRYGVLDIYENGYQYNSHRISDILGCDNFGEYSFDVFCDEYYAKTLWSYQGKMEKEKGEEAVRLLSEINSYYFDGSYEEIQELLRKNRKLIKLIKENTSGYDDSYIRSIIEVEKENQHSLLIKR